jgi:hypothetical protein
MTARTRISPVHAALYAFGVVGIAGASLGFSSSHPRPALAPPPKKSPLLLTGSDGPSCPLSIKQQVDAVKAFGEMLPVFRHPRCINCHGGLDPMSDRHPGKGQIEDITDRDSLLAACQDCHDGLKGWRVPGAPGHPVHRRRIRRRPRARRRTGRLPSRDREAAGNAGGSGSEGQEMGGRDGRPVRRLT